MENKEIELLSLSKAAELMHIGKERLYKLINNGKIGWIIMGKKRFIPYADVVRYIKDNTQYASTASGVYEFSTAPDISSNEEFNSMEIFNKIKGEILNGQHL